MRNDMICSEEWRSWNVIIALINGYDKKHPTSSFVARDRERREKGGEEQSIKSTSVTMITYVKVTG